MREGIEANFKGFATIRKDGALMGPWNPWLHEPAFGKPVWELTKALSVKPSLPPAVREVAILVTRTSGLRMNFMRMLSPRRIAD